MAIFDHSWYRQVLSQREQGTPNRKVHNTFAEITSFERLLTADGMVIVKFFLHISKEEQKKRLGELEANPATAWRVTKKDWKQNKRYPQFVEDVEETLLHTDSEFSPWVLVEANDECFATLKVVKTVVDALQRAIINRETVNQAAAPHSSSPDSPAVMDASILARTDLSLSLTRTVYEREKEKSQKRLLDLTQLVHLRRIPVVIVYSGWDAAGKGGNIRRLVQCMDPRGYEVIPVSAPNDIEKAYHYLHRFWIRMPKAGHIAVFDRSWYERVMVERVEGFCTEAEWKRAYREINEMEQQLVDFGCVLVKFWLHIDQDEQLCRFESRRDDPRRNWKITEEDWRNRAKWDRYREAVDEMLYRTSTREAPWTIVESNCKWYARIKTMKSVINAIENTLERS
jgi:polyphosphate:AMP phosphotransferase